MPSSSARRATAGRFWGTAPAVQLCATDFETPAMRATSCRDNSRSFITDSKLRLNSIATWFLLLPDISQPHNSSGFVEQFWPDIRLCTPCIPRYWTSSNCPHTALDSPGPPHSLATARVEPRARLIAQGRVTSGHTEQKQNRE
jgi:hypothetical protein